MALKALTVQDVYVIPPVPLVHALTVTLRCEGPHRSLTGHRCLLWETLLCHTALQYVDAKQSHFSVWVQGAILVSSIIKSLPAEAIHLPPIYNSHKVMTPYRSPPHIHVQPHVCSSIERGGFNAFKKWKFTTFEICEVCVLEIFVIEDSVTLVTCGWGCIYRLQNIFHASATIVWLV